MAKDADVVKELGQLRDEVRQLQEAVAKLTTTRREAPAAARIRTFVEGLDDALEGGIPAGHVVILAGPSGSMKTSVALSAVHRNRKAGTKGLYMSLEEGRESLLRTMERLGMAPEDDFIIDIGKLRMEHAEAEQAPDWLQILKDYLARRMEKERVGLLVIDPLNSLYALAELKDPRKDLFHFFTFLRGLGVTTILIAESEGPEHFPDHEEFLADGAITLSYVTDADGHVDLRIHCVKMRHTNHSRDYFRLEFEDGRFRARPLGGA